MPERRLSQITLTGTRAGVARPGYDRSRASGIVHLGVGAFHKAHQAVATDDAMNAAGGDWMITGVSLRAPKVAEELNPQDGLYTLLVRDTEGTAARIVGSIGKVLVPPRDPGASWAGGQDGDGVRRGGGWAGLGLRLRGRPAVATEPAWARQREL